MRPGHQESWLNAFERYDRIEGSVCTSNSRRMHIASTGVRACSTG